MDRWFQNNKSVAVHVAEWSQLFNTIDLADNQEKVVKLFNSFKCRTLPEGIGSRSLDLGSGVKAAEQAEILAKVEENNRQAMSETEYQSQEDEEDYEYDESEEGDVDAPVEKYDDNDEVEDNKDKSSERGSGGRVEMPPGRGETMREAAVGVDTQSDISTSQARRE